MGMRRRLVVGALAACVALVRARVPQETSQVLVNELSVSSAVLGAAAATTERDAHKAALASHADDDADNDDDDAAFTFAAAQQEAARLLSSYDSDALLDDDDDDDDEAEEEEAEDDSDYRATSVSETEEQEEALVSIETAEPNDSPSAPVTDEPTSDPSVRRVAIRLTRSTVVSADAASDAVVTSEPDKESASRDAEDDAPVIESAVVALDAAVREDAATRQADVSTADESSRTAPVDAEDERSSSDAAAVVAESDASTAASGFGAALVKIRAVIYPDAPLDEAVSVRSSSDADERIDTVDLVDDELPDSPQASAVHSDEQPASDDAQSVVLDEGSYDALVATADTVARVYESRLREDATATCEQDAPAELIGAVTSVSESEVVDAVGSVEVVSELEAASESTDAAVLATTESVEPVEIETASSPETEEMAVAVTDVQQPSAISPLDASALDQCLSPTEPPRPTAEATEPKAQSRVRDDADEPVARSSRSSFQEIALEMATAMEQIVYELRLGRRPQVPVAFTAAAARVRGTARAYSRSVSEPIAETAHALSALLAAASADAALALESGREQALVVSERIGHSLRNGSRFVRSVSHDAIDWCREVWSSYEAVRVVGRNLRGLALLLLAALLFCSLYRFAAAAPDVVLTYVLSLDDVTRAQLKIFAAALVVLVVYHAHVLAWFWLALLATLGYYYWSGHVVITVEFK